MLSANFKPKRTAAAASRGFGDLFPENCEFFLPHSHLTPSLNVNPVEFLDELLIPKTRVLGLSVGEDFVIVACVV